MVPARGSTMPFTEIPQFPCVVVPGHMGSLVALPRALLLSVPMPNTSEPFHGAAAPVAPTAGNSMITPLLSVANFTAGFGNCSCGVTVPVATSAQLAAAVQV